MIKSDSQLVERISIVFVIGNDEDKPLRLADITIGRKFKFGEKTYTKLNQYGWNYGICNVMNEDGFQGWIHPSKLVELLGD